MCPKESNKDPLLFIIEFRNQSIRIAFYIEDNPAVFKNTRIGIGSQIGNFLFMQGIIDNCSLADRKLEDGRLHQITKSSNQ